MLKKVLIFLGVLLIVLLVCGVAAWTIAGSRLTGSMEGVVAHPLSVPTDSGAIANGNRLATAYGCRDCHGDDLAGKVMIEEGAFMVIYAPNLTAGEGGTAEYSSSDWDLTLRHGIGPDGRTLIIMPSGSYAKMNDQDMGEIVAYIQSLPPVDRTVPPPAFGPASRIAALAGADELIPARAVDHEAPHPAATPREPTVAYGAYLASAGCTGCHGADYSGLPAGPGMDLAASNLTPHPEFGLGQWTFEDFDRAVRSGRRPDGTVISTTMPWAALSALTYDEVLALWRYLETVPPLAIDRRSPEP